ncbi:MAG: hypothetical protein QG610_1694 [Euryarchaeota archaeon]|nr:hypothetical protein [Euryarchaeota archaeon]
MQVGGVSGKKEEIVRNKRASKSDFLEGGSSSTEGRKSKGIRGYFLGYAGYHGWSGTTDCPNSLIYRPVK